MSWRDDINRRLRELGNIIEIPPDKLDSVRKVLENTWRDATCFDSSWDSD